MFIKLQDNLCMSSHLTSPKIKKSQNFRLAIFFQITERMRLYSLARWCESRPSGKLHGNLYFPKAFACRKTFVFELMSSHLIPSIYKKTAKLASYDFFSNTERMRLYSLARWCESRPLGKLHSNLYFPKAFACRKTFVFELVSSHLTSPKIKKSQNFRLAIFFQITDVKERSTGSIFRSKNRLNFHKFPDPR